MNPQCRDPHGGDRATSSVLGVVLFVVLTVFLAAVVGGVVLGLPAAIQPTAPTPIILSVTVDAADQRVQFVHDGGRPLNVRMLTIRLTVDGVPLDHQPPIPFFAAHGFRAGPTGPFNQAADPHWTTGETASFRLAGTNAPAVTPEATIVVDIYQRDSLIVHIETTAR